MSKKRRDFIIVSHCLLNPHSRVHILGKQFGLPHKICSYLLLNKIAIIQLPCPEFMVMGYIRNPQGRQQYNNIMFKNQCKELLNRYILMIEELINNNHRLIAYLGIQGSPTCSIFWGNHKHNKFNTESMIDDTNNINENNYQLGVLSEILQERLNEINITIPFIEVPVKETNPSEVLDKFWDTLKNTIENNITISL